MVAAGVLPENQIARIANSSNSVLKLECKRRLKSAAAYGVWREKFMYGRKYMGIERTVVIIDHGGRIQRIIPKMKPTGHGAEVLALL